MGRGRGRGHDAALRRADGLRRTARRLSRHARRVQALHAGAARGRHRRRQRRARVSARAADARAAHPAREGDVEHMHGAGAARRHGEHVCRLSRRRGPRAHRAPDAPADRDPQGRPAAQRAQRADRRVLRHHSRRHGRAHRADRRTRAAGRREPASQRPARGRHLARRDHHGEGRGAPVAHLRRTRCALQRRRARCANGGCLARGARARLGVPHASHVPAPSLRNADAALPAAPRRQGHRARPLDDPARLVHHEAQRDGGDDPRHLARVRAPASVRARRPGAGLRGAHRRSRAHAVRDHGLRRGVAAAQRRLARRVRGPARDPGVSREPRRRPSQRVPHSRVGARHQPGVRADGGPEGGGRRLRRRRQRRHRRSRSEGRRASRRSRRDHGDVPVDARRVRGRHPARVRDRARPWRPGVRRRREPQCARGPRGAGPVRRRRLAPQPAQDVLHSARRRRSGRGADRRRRASRAVPAGPSGIAVACGGHRCRGRRAVRQRVDPAHLVDVHHDDGRGRPHRSHAARDPRRQLRRAPARRPVSRALRRARTASSRTSASSICGRCARRATSPSTTSPSA